MSRMEFASYILGLKFGQTLLFWVNQLYSYFFGFPKFCITSLGLKHGGRSGNVLYKYHFESSYITETEKSKDLGYFSKDLR